MHHIIMVWVQFDILKLEVMTHGANNKFNGDVYSSQSKADVLIRLLTHQRHEFQVQ